MHELDPVLLDRLDALGARAHQQPPPMPAALGAAVAVRGTRTWRVPLPAIVAAVAVIAAGGSLVVFGLPARVRHGGTVIADGPLGSPVTLMSMMARYNRVGTVDAAVVPGSAATASAGPVYRPADARSGEVPE